MSNTSPQNTSYNPLGAYNFTMEKCTKYQKVWQMRSWILKGLDLSYTNNKSSMSLEGVLRSAEKGGNELYGMVLSGSQEEKWFVRCSDKEHFHSVYSLLCTALVHFGKLEDPQCGLPPLDPRTHLPFVDVPLEHLSRFSLLSKYVLHFFGEIEEKLLRTVVPGNNAEVVSEPKICVLSDKNLYLCRTNADIARCSRVHEIQKVIYSPPYLGIVLPHPGDYDMFLIIHDPETMKKLITGLTTVYAYNKQGNNLTFVQGAGGKALTDKDMEKLLTLTVPPDWKITCTMPTSKKSLSEAIHLYEQKLKKQREGQAEAPEEKELQDFVPRSETLGLFLLALHLESYYPILVGKHVDMEVLKCMEDEDFKTFGIHDKQHRQLIQRALLDETFLQEIDTEVAKYVAAGGALQDKKMKEAILQQRAAGQQRKAAAQTHTQKTVDENPKGGNDPGQIGSPGSAAPVASASPEVKKNTIILDFDDIMLPPTNPTKKPNKATFTLDSDDDDGPIPPKATPKASSINLDSDDDLPVPKVTPKPSSISLDSDDDLPVMKVAPKAPTINLDDDNIVLPQPKKVIALDDDF